MDNPDQLGAKVYLFHYETGQYSEIFYGGEYRMSDGLTAWIYNNEKGEPLLSRSGVKVDFSDMLGMIPEGLVLEFGVAGGKSIREIAKHVPKVYGFDWWKGLPHAWCEADPKGVLACEKPTDLPPNCELIDGLFSDTLEPFLLGHPGAVAFVHIDCDLFCPSLYILHCLKERFVKGSIIAFDEMDQMFPDWNGEARAWRQYLSETDQVWEFIGKQHQWGKVFQLRQDTP